MKEYVVPLPLNPLIVPFVTEIEPVENPVTAVLNVATIGSGDVFVGLDKLVVRFTRGRVLLNVRVTLLLARELFPAASKELFALTLTTTGPLVDGTISNV